MSSAYRTDLAIGSDFASALGKPQRTSRGYLVPAVIARVGILEYVDSGRIVREYNPPDVLLAALDSLRDAPVTNAHPPELVSSRNFREFVVGHVVGAPELRGGMLHATLAIHDARLISEVDGGLVRDVSAGYRAMVDERSGIAPDGCSYDKARTWLDFNHVAVVARGRAGRDVALQLDSLGGGSAEAARAEMLRERYGWGRT